MIPDAEIWEQRGKRWYRKGIPSCEQAGYHIRTCAQCGKEALVVGDGRFCSRACADVTTRGRRLDSVTYRTAHQRVQRARGKASGHPCVDCGSAAAEWSYDLRDADELIGTGRFAGKSYSLKPEHYHPRCIPCHQRHDGNAGETHYNAKLTEAQRREVIGSNLRHGTSDSRELADRLGVSTDLIYKIRRRAAA